VDIRVTIVRNLDMLMFDLIQKITYNKVVVYIYIYIYIYIRYEERRVEKE
jgi:hypothetical protein